MFVNFVPNSIAGLLPPDPSFSLVPQNASDTLKSSVMVRLLFGALGVFPGFLSRHRIMAEL